MASMHLPLFQREAVHIREAVPADAHAVLDHLKTVAAETDFLTFDPDEVNATAAVKRAEIDHFRHSPVHLMLVAESQGRIIGGLSFKGEDNRRVRHRGEFGLTVEKGYWGLGIGRGLIVALLDWAQGTGCIRKINLRVREDNHRAIALYESLGFVREGMVSRDYRVDDRFFASLLMGFELNAPVV